MSDKLTACMTRTRAEFRQVGFTELQADCVVLTLEAMLSTETALRDLEEQGVSRAALNLLESSFSDSLRVAVLILVDPNAECEGPQALADEADRCTSLIVEAYKQAWEALVSDYEAMLLARTSFEGAPLQ